MALNSVTLTVPPPSYEATWVTFSSPDFGSRESVTTAELVRPFGFVPVMRHEAVVALVPLQIAVTPVKPLEV